MVTRRFAKPVDVQCNIQDPAACCFNCNENHGISAHHHGSTMMMIERF